MSVDSYKERENQSDKQLHVESAKFLVKLSVKRKTLQAIYWDECTRFYVFIEEAHTKGVA